MFKVFINDGTQKIPNDDIFYIVCKSGIYLKKKLGIVESIAKVDKISILEDVKSYVKLHINKIPSYQFLHIVDFFKKVYTLYHSEAMVLLYYNENKGDYKIIIPKQEVSCASIKYKKEASHGDYSLICSIHSHGNMSAFHSGTDVSDEENFDGLHITLGDIDDKYIDIKASIVSNGTRFVVDPLDYIIGIKEVSIEKTIPSFTSYGNMFPQFGLYDFEHLYEKEEVKKPEKKITYETKYKCIQQLECPKSWFTNVHKEIPKIVQFKTFDHFNTDTNINNSNFTVDMDMLRMAEQDPDYIPCNDCAFKEYKVELQKEDLEDMLDEYPNLLS